MVLNYKELSELAEQMKEAGDNYDYSYETDLKREVKTLSKDWWIDFLIGVILGSYL